MAKTLSVQSDTLRSTGGDTLWVTAYQRYYRLWMSLARSSHASTEDAQDIVHGVIAGILNNGSPQFESLEHIRNYVAKGVLNRVILHHQKSLRKVPLLETHEPVMDPYLDGTDSVGGDPRVLRELIGSLKQRDFEIIKLRFFSGLTFLEISQLTGKPVSTLKSREVSALKKLYKALRKKGTIHVTT